MQSWGTQDRFTVRGTDLMPSLSGVIGLLMAAMGMPESGPIGPLAYLEMGVRADRPGEQMVDYQTIRGGKDGSFGPADAVQSYRHYLCDAAFLVALSGSDPDLLVNASLALARPKNSLFLGRRCCIPSTPILHSVVPGDDLDAELRMQPSLISEPPPRWLLELPATVETATAMRMDRPLSFVSDRRAYMPRYVRQFSIPSSQVV